MTLNQLAGILPAIVFPAATLLQLLRIVRHRSAVGVSVPTWLLFGFANLGMYVYAERYAEWQAILGMLLTAVVDFAIVGLVVSGYGRPSAVLAQHFPVAGRPAVSAAARRTPTLVSTG